MSAAIGFSASIHPVAAEVAGLEAIPAQAEPPARVAATRILADPGPLYTIHAFTQRRDCRHCGPCEIEVEGPIETRLDTLGEDIALAADDEAESLGWKSGFCPHCAWEHREYLSAEHHADFEEVES